MTSNRQFFKHTLIFGVGGILGQLVPLILLPLYTHYLPPVDYGILDVVIKTSDIINTIFLVGGIRLAAMTFYKQAENEEARRRIAVTISTLLWVAVAVAITASIVFVDYIEYFLKTEDTKLLAFGMATALLGALVGVPMTLMQARLESLRYVLTHITMSLVRLGLSVYFIAGLHWGIWGALYAQALVSSVSAILLTYRELRIGSIYPDTSKWKEILLFALPLVPTGILAFFYGMSDRIFILHFGPYERSAAMGAVGLYALAGRLMEVSGMMGVAPMQRVWTAEMYDVYKQPDASMVFGNFALRLLCVQAFAVTFISIFSTEIVRVMSGNSYHDAALIIPLFGIYSLLSLFAAQMNNTFYITRKTNYIFFCNMFALPFMLHFMLLFVPYWGIMGAIIAFILSHTVYVGVVYVVSRRFFYIRYPFGKMAMLLAITALCYGLSCLCGCGVEECAASSKWEKIAGLWNNIQWFSITGKAGVMFLWGITVWFSGILSPEDKAIAHQVVKKGLQKMHLYKR